MCSISSSVLHFLMKSSKDNHGEVCKIGKTKYQLKLQKVFTPRLRTFNDHLIVLMIADGVTKANPTLFSIFSLNLLYRIRLCFNSFYS